MPLPNDLTLNGVDYTVMPGSYRKRNAAASAAVNPRDVRRLTLGPFGRGQRQAFDARSPAADARLATAGWDSVGVGPCFDGQLVYAPKAANNQEELRLSGTKWNGNAVTHLRYLDSPIVRMGLFNGKVAIATRTGLYLMGGEPYPGEADDATVTADTSKAPAWLGNPEPIMTHGQFAAEDDFSFLESYRGRLYTWLAGRVAEFDDSQEQGRWARTGPEGFSCRGATIASDWLIIALTSRYELTHELWGFNGEGWWLLAQRASPHFLWPCPVGGAGNRDLLVFRHAAADYDLYRLKWRDKTLPTYAAGGAWTSSLLDAGDPTRDKAWRAFGATFAQPVNRGKSDSSDQVTITLDYSLDGGQTWSTAASQNTTAAATRLFTLQSAFAAIPTARHCQLRVTWSSVVDWAPVLVGVWAEVATLDNAPNRRRWELTVAAGDRAVRRDGQLDPQSGRQKIAALWDAWEARATLDLLDVDHDTEPVTYQVRIEEIDETVTKPADAARWGESQVALTLAEV